MNSSDRKRRGGSVIKIVWSIVLDYIWSKKICRPKQDDWSLPGTKCVRYNQEDFQSIWKKAQCVHLWIKSLCHKRKKQCSTLIFCKAWRSIVKGSLTPGGAKCARIFKKITNVAKSLNTLSFPTPCSEELHMSWWYLNIDNLTNRIQEWI